MKSRYIPQNAETREFPEAGVIAYCFDSPKGPALTAYKGRRSKPAHHIAFSCTERRDRYLADYVEREKEVEDFKRERQQAAHGLEVGDIVYCVWGYEQTNVTFYQVVRVPSGRSATIRKLHAEITPSASCDMSGTTTPKPDHFDKQEKEETRRAAGWQTLNGGRYGGSLQKWDGTPRRVTWYA